MLRLGQALRGLFLSGKRKVGSWNENSLVMGLEFVALHGEEEGLVDNKSHLLIETEP